jgi:hypothetical protein
MKRRLVWLQLLLGWFPVWALFTTLILTAHEELDLGGATLIGLRLMIAGALLGLVVFRGTERLPWPHPFRLSFLATHVAGAALYSAAWLALNSIVETIARGHLVLITGFWLAPYLLLGVWLYVMTAGVAYATQATERAARAELAATQSQLAALRAQLNPHFLFNALHAVVQLIPRAPQRASRAAEQLAGLLRATIEEDRDLVSLGEEWAFVERYLALEEIRLGERLAVTVDLPDDVREATVPSFSVQTLVENAVKHGVAPRVEPTAIRVEARRGDRGLVVTVSDTGDGVGTKTASVDETNGTGLRRLRERLSVLYGAGAGLEIDGGANGGSRATLTVPQPPDE